MPRWLMTRKDAHTMPRWLILLIGFVLILVAIILIVEHFHVAAH